MKYMDKALSSEERAKELLKIMTTEVKLAQLRTKLLQNYITDDGKVSEFNDIGKEGIGGFTFERIIMPYSIEEEAEIINAIHKKIKEETRLGIPPIINAEALHGLCLRGTTSFPQAIGLAATWDRDIMQKVAGVIASECKARGIRQVLSPTVDIARDLRWGRVEETYGEDAVLTSELAVAFCKAFEEVGIITTPKHFVANSGDGGRDSAPVYHSEKILKQVYFKPYAACFKRAGSRSVMASYNALNGVPAGLNKWLLTDMLKKYMGFKGFTVTDYRLMEKAKRLHKVSSDMSEIAARAVKAGLHRELPDDGGYLFLNEALSKGLINEEEIDRLVTDILRVKFEIGLFDDSLKYDGKSAQKLCNCPEHRDVAYKAAQKSIVLLKMTAFYPLNPEKRQ